MGCSCSESYTIRQQLAQTRQELSTALYQHDAAMRVIARLTTERDEARDALSKVTISTGGASNGDQMQIDSEGLPEELAAKVNATQEKLSKSRRKRPTPKGWATSDLIESYTVTSASETLYPGSSSVAVDVAGDLALVGGSDGVAGIYGLGEGKLLQALKAGGGAITDTLWCADQPVVAISSGNVKVFHNGKETASFTSHAGAANAIALHPSNEILASVGADKSFVFYDLLGAKPITQVYTDSALTAAAFHPDGHLFAAGGEDGQIKFFSTTTGTSAATFGLGTPVKSLVFSENGFWFAAVAKGSTSVIIFDLRKDGQDAQVKVLDIGNQVDSINWDYSGQFLATAGPSGITVQQYAKSSKSWSEPLRSAVPATAVQWGPQGQSLVCVNSDGVVSVLGTK